MKFVDNSSVEVFANDGLVVFSKCIFPSEKGQGNRLYVKAGKVTHNLLDIYNLKPVKLVN